ncbi:hypothetical protein BC835DRAFT_809197 [Cytidiella melzeri]|nr:hypothetical protein BC835DRAFT_809197 [Cytidiella melzeri]
MRGCPTPPTLSTHQLSPQPSTTHFLPNDTVRIDPALFAQPLNSKVLLGQLHVGPPSIAARAVSEKKYYPQYCIQYPQGYQGDPFAHPDPPASLQLQAPPSLQLKLSKQRKTLRKNVCSVCRGEQTVGTNESENLLTCVDCESRGHPSSLDLTHPKQAAQQCAACKTCETDGDNRVLLCDFCDRDWHTDCPDTTFATAPPGGRYCLRIFNIVRGVHRTSSGVFSRVLVTFCYQRQTEREEQSSHQRCVRGRDGC